MTRQAGHQDARSTRDAAEHTKEGDKSRSSAVSGERHSKQRDLSSPPRSHSPSSSLLQQSAPAPRSGSMRIPSTSSAANVSALLSAPFRSTSALTSSLCAWRLASLAPLKCKTQLARENTKSVSSRQQSVLFLSSPVATSRSALRAQAPSTSLSTAPWTRHCSCAAMACATGTAPIVILSSRVCHRAQGGSRSSSCHCLRCVPPAACESTSLKRARTA